MLGRLEAVDSDRDGKLAAQEFVQFCQQLHLTQEDVEALCRICKIDGTDSKKLLTISEFQSILENRLKERQEAQEKIFKKLLDCMRACTMTIEQLFSLLDQDKSGFVNFEKLKEGLRKLHVEIVHCDLIKIFAIFDRDKSNSISLSELSSVLSEFELIKLQGKFTDDMEQIWQAENIELDDEADKKPSLQTLISEQLKLQLQHVRKLPVLSADSAAQNVKIILEATIQGAADQFRAVVEPDSQGSCLNIICRFTYSNIKLKLDAGDLLEIVLCMAQNGLQENYLDEAQVS